MISTLYPIFQSWSQHGSIYLISDTHFEDTDCKLMDNRWPSPEEYIKNLSKITKNDTVIHLGDVGNPKWMQAVKGYKVLIKGNHDAGNHLYQRTSRRFEYDFPTLSDVKKAKQCGDITHFFWNVEKNVYEGYFDNQLFDEIYSGPLMIAENLILSHEPISLSASITGNFVAFNIHGHDHNQEFMRDKYHYNIAANIVNFQPINLKDIIKQGYLSNKNIKSVHREIIDRATEKKYRKGKNEA